MRRAAIVLAILAVACGAPGMQVVPLRAIVSGTYSGTDSSGGLQWTIQQSEPGLPVTGTGTFLATGATTPVRYNLSGTYVAGMLELRLLGAPGDTDADSVWFGGRSINELYMGAAFSGSLYGPTSSLFGPLSMYLTANP